MAGLSREKKQVIVIIATVLCLASTSLIFFRSQIATVTKASSIHAPIIP